MMNGYCECRHVTHEIDGYPPRPFGYHIYRTSKATWHEITDDLAQYETDPAD
jgi:hypothetical protein